MSETNETIIEPAKWYVVDHDTDTILRGPYEHSETAGVVRRHMEQRDERENREDRNYWIEAR